MSGKFIPQSMIDNFERQFAEKRDVEMVKSTTMA